MDFTTNYCGPYWSHGKFQSSVSNGSNAPVSELDAACQRHDAGYADALTEDDLNVADTKFYKETRSLGPRGWLYGNIVYYFNKFNRRNRMDYRPESEIKQLEWMHRTSKPVIPHERNENYVLTADNSPPVSDITTGELPSNDLPARYFPFKLKRRRRTRHRKQKQ